MRPVGHHGLTGFRDFRIVQRDGLDGVGDKGLEFGVSICESIRQISLVSRGVFESIRGTITERFRIVCREGLVNARVCRLEELDELFRIVQIEEDEQIAQRVHVEGWIERDTSCRIISRESDGHICRPLLQSDDVLEGIDGLGHSDEFWMVE